MATQKTLLPSRLAVYCTLAGVVSMCAATLKADAQSTDKFYYWVTPSPGNEQETESFVIEVDAAQKAEIDQIRANRGFPGFGGRVAAGPVAYNKDYYAPGQPVWNWHVIVDSIYNRNGANFPFVVDPMYDANPSDIAVDPKRWIEENGPQYTPRDYAIFREVDPSQNDGVVNVSNRGMTGAGEKALITGFIIKGGEPRNVVVRALGPSMSAAGVQQVAANPRIEVYGSTGRQIAANANWKTDPRSPALSESLPSLAPTNDKEAALLLTLLPGTYTLHGLNEDGTEGVVLLEAYDVDSNSE